jgi:hypothetical protein
MKETELTKEEYVRLEIIKALAAQIQWPPNESTKSCIEFLAGVVLNGANKSPS